MNKTTLVPLFYYSLEILTYIVFSLICQFIYVILPGRQPLHYYLCTNLQPDQDSQFKQNWPTLILQVVSFSIHIFVNVKIKILNKKQIKSLQHWTFSEQMKLGDILSMESQSISNFLTSLLVVVASSSFIITSSIINNTHPYELNKVRFYLKL